VKTLIEEGYLKDPKEGQGRSGVWRGDGYPTQVRFARIVPIMTGIKTSELAGAAGCTSAPKFVGAGS